MLKTKFKIKNRSPKHCRVMKSAKGLSRIEDVRIGSNNETQSSLKSEKWQLRVNNQFQNSVPKFNPNFWSKFSQEKYKYKWHSCHIFSSPDFVGLLMKCAQDRSLICLKFCYTILLWITSSGKCSWVSTLWNNVQCSLCIASHQTSNWTTFSKKEHFFRLVFILLWFCTLKRKSFVVFAFCFFASHAIDTVSNPYAAFYCFCFFEIIHVWYDFLYNSYACECWTCDDKRLMTDNEAYVCILCILVSFRKQHGIQKNLSIAPASKDQLLLESTLVWSGNKLESDWGIWILGFLPCTGSIVDYSQKKLALSLSLSFFLFIDVKLINLFLPSMHGRKSNMKTIAINIKTINFRSLFKIGNWKISSWLVAWLFQIFF